MDLGKSTISETLHLVTLVCASICLYLAGMVLNDVWDFEEDQRDRPAAAAAGGNHLVFKGPSNWFGTFSRWSHLWMGCHNHLGTNLSGITATVLAIAVVAYDIGLKRTMIGPVVMGSCRWLNVLLGMTGGAKSLAVEFFGRLGRSFWQPRSEFT